MKFIEDFENELQKLFNSEEYTPILEFLESIVNDENSEDLLKNKVFYHLGRLCFYNHEFEKSKLYFQNAINNNEIDVYSRIFLGIIAEKESKFEDSLRIFSSCLETNPELLQLNYKIQKLSLNFSVSDEKIDTLIKTVESKIHFRVNQYPLISIIILCYNKLEFTQKCLKSVFSNTFYSNYEVLVVDNASVDDTPGFLEAYGNKIKFIHSNRNLGFVGGNNLASEYAQGEYIVFLNNDTEVTANWLKHLYNTFIQNPNAGAVGSMLIYPDGSLQEAGGVIFNDASGWNYGKGNQIIDSKYSFLREVDYCSGAALMVRKDLFLKHGKFDERFAPAYYEDTDLCFGIRKLGYKVFYCPLSKVIHYEGATAGTDTSKGVKKYQVINKPKFIEKWKNELKTHYQPNPNLRYLFSNRTKGKRILIIDDIPPLPNRAAGALRHYHTLKQMLNLGFQVTYVHLMGREYNDENSRQFIDEFRMKGVEFFWFNYESWWHYRESKENVEILQNLIASLELEFRHFDFVYIAFWYIANYFVDLIRIKIPNTPIIIDTMDVHYLRELRQAELSKDKKFLEKATETKKNELAVYSKADCITTVTENDRDILKKELPNKSILILTDVHDSVETLNGFSERKDFLFVGNFNHNPNEDAVLYFVKSIFPLIKKEIKDAKFYIAGNKPSEKLKALSSDDIIVTGWVPEVKPYLEKCRVSVVPLRFGAGNKGKVGETLSYGLPMVSTTVGAEGMGIINEVHSYVSDDPQKFAEYAVKLYNNEQIWNEFSSKGKTLISLQYSSELMRKRLKYITSFNSRKMFSSQQALNCPNPPKVSIVLVSFNQYEFTQKCISSIQENTKIPYEIILVDNNSSDKTVLLTQKHFETVKIVPQKTNLGFPIAVNLGINNSIGEYILLINNDTIVTEGWLERMLEIAEAHPEIGIVGPISNSVSGRQLDKNAKYESIEDMHKYAQKVKNENNGQFFQFPRVAFLCTLVKKEVIDKIGGLDELFSPGNFEDDDFCLRAQMVGYKTVIATDVFIHHYGSVSFKANGESEYAKRIEINGQKFVDKWGADPEEIWIKGIKPKQREVKFAINLDNFVQHIERAFINIDENEHFFAIENLEIAIANFKTSDRKGYENLLLDELMIILGNLYIATNNLEKAKETFEMSLNENPNSSLACQGLGDVFSLVDEFEAAKTMYEWSIKNDETNEKAVEKLIMANQKLGLEPTDFSLNEEN